MPTPGTLYVVPTPIGNLGDITLRAVDTLRDVDAVVAEDTRRSRQLLSHLGIRKPLRCIDAHASDSAIAAVVAQLAAGESVAMMTDAGMPCISDPGSRLIAAARVGDVPVVVLPGPSAVTTALAASGLGDGAFVFAGFPPRKGEKRRRFFEKLVNEECPVVFFEAPSRMVPTLNDLASLAPERQLCVARELSKKFEEVTTRALAQWIQQPREWRGECTLVLAGQQAQESAGPPEDLEPRILAALEEGKTVKTIVDELLAGSELSRRELYARVLACKDGESVP